MQEKITTLVLVQKDDRVLLGMKKRGFGEGRWNGFGGKVAPSETIEEAARRELEEEAGIKAINLEKRGEIRFLIASDDLQIDVHIFHAGTFEGEPVESEEMAPQWFAYDEIPYDAMWPDDQYWLPLFLDGKTFKGMFHFRDHHHIEKYQLEEIKKAL